MPFSRIFDPVKANRELERTKHIAHAAQSAVISRRTVGGDPAHLIYQFCATLDCPDDIGYRRRVNI